MIGYDIVEITKEEEWKKFKKKMWIKHECQIRMYLVKRIIVIILIKYTQSEFGRKKLKKMKKMF